MNRRLVRSSSAVVPVVLIAVVLGVFAAGLLAPPSALATMAQSSKVALIPNAAGRYPGAGVMPTYGSGFEAFTFSNLEPADIDPIGLNLFFYDTLVFLQFGDASTALSPTQKTAIVNWIGAGGKLIIYDSDACPSGDYGWLPTPFTTDNPGQLGAHGGTLTVVEENTLSSADPLSPYYIDTTAICAATDAVGDANVMLTKDASWFGDMEATNANGKTGWVHTYASFGSGLIIYNGLDTDYIGSSSGLQKLWLQELKQPWDPDGLPRDNPVSGPPKNFGVVFVNGMGQSAPQMMDPPELMTADPKTNLSYFFRLTQQAGYRAFMIGAKNSKDASPTAIDSGGDLARNALAMQEYLRAVKRCGVDDVVIVAHSMGGVMARLFVEIAYKTTDDSLPRVVELVTLGSPHAGFHPGGETVVDLMAAYGWLKGRSIDLAKQMSPDEMMKWNALGARRNKQVPYVLIGGHVSPEQLSDVSGGPGAKLTALRKVFRSVVWPNVWGYLDHGADVLVYEPSALGYEIAGASEGQSIFAPEYPEDPNGRAVTRCYAGHKWHGLPDSGSKAFGFPLADFLKITEPETLTFDTGVYEDFVAPALEDAVAYAKN